MKFRISADSPRLGAVFYAYGKDADGSATETPIRFENGEVEVDDKAQIAALKALAANGEPIEAVAAGA